MDKIPEGVYYSAQHDNFYSTVDLRGMGTPFYHKWKDRADEFPQIPVEE